MEGRAAPCQPRQPFEHSVANHFKLAIGKGVAGQGIQREKGLEPLPTAWPSSSAASLG
jgi:hypothetical protein